MNHQPEGFSTNPAEDSPLETLRMSAASRELPRSNYGNVGHRSHLYPLPSLVEGFSSRAASAEADTSAEADASRTRTPTKVRLLRSPTWEPEQSSGSPGDERRALGLGLDGYSAWDEGIPARSKSAPPQSIPIDSQSAKIDPDDRSIDNSYLLANPESLPFRDLSKIARQRVTIVAPHPDDETLGCGGAISLLCRKGYDVRVLVISDGTLSHPNSRKYPAHALQSIRARETQTALAILGVHRSAITFLGLKDGSVPTLTSTNFQTAKLRCQNYLRLAAPDTIFLPWRFDPHPDHRATWQLIQAAILSLGITPQTIEYPIWDWDRQQQQKVPDLDKIAGWRLDIGAALDLKLNAISAYRSQLGLLIDDDPNGFCLTADLLTNFTRSWEVYFEETL